jgi:hypothetical protein
MVSGDVCVAAGDQKNSIKGTARAAGAAVVLPALGLCIGLPPLDYERLSLIPCIFQCGYEVLGRLACLEIHRLQIHCIAPVYFVCDANKISASAGQKKRLLARTTQRG